ncbi:MAG: RNA polymerase sigma factor, partial [Actinomycetota bacterium]
MKVSGASRGATGGPRTRPGNGTDESRARSAGESDDLEDRKLIFRVSRGDDRALGCLYDRYAPAAYGLAVKVCGSRVLAEDVVQEAFLSIWRRVGSFNPERGSVASFLLGAVHNKAVDAVRHEESVHRREQAFSDQPEVGIEQEPEEAAWLVCRRDQVRRAVTR